MNFKVKKRTGSLLLSLALILTMIVVLLSGCSGKEKKDSFVVVTSFYPMYVFTENIVDGLGDIELKNLTQPQTGCLHDYQMKPSDMSALEEADLFIVNGAGMESFIDKVKKAYPKLKIVEASNNIQLLKDKNGEMNPHVWVGVSNAIEEVKNITDALISAKPENKDEFLKNETAYLSRLEELKVKMHKALAKYKGNKIVTFHEAFPYFAEEFDLIIASVIEREPGSEPSASELAQTIDIVNASGLKALFSEPQYSSRTADVISRETGAKIYTLDPFVTGTVGTGKDAYEKTMEENLKVLIEAFK